jgi:quinol monooxygenase YgiN
MADEGRGSVVLINTFTVAPDDQERLIALLAQITRESIVTAPGFLSATLHRSLDARKVTMYARWRSAQDYAAMRQGGQSRDALDAIAAIATFEPGMYEIVDEFRPQSEADTASPI